MNNTLGLSELFIRSLKRICSSKQSIWFSSNKLVEGKSSVPENSLKYEFIVKTGIWTAVLKSFL
jgi:hypothetical protein